MTRGSLVTSCGRPDGQHPALVEHEHRVGQPHDRGHDVLDEDQRDAVLARAAPRAGRSPGSRSDGTSPASTSSSSSTRGRLASARASSSRLRPAVGRPLLCTSRHCRVPTRSTTSAATRSASPARWYRRRMAATATFSSTVIEPNGRISWNVRTMPACGDPVRCEPGDVAAVEVHAAAVGLSAPATRLNRVVLPAPLGPMMPWMLPSSTSKATSSTARETAEGPADVLDPQQAHRRAPAPGSRRRCPWAAAAR